MDTPHVSSAQCCQRRKCKPIFQFISAVFIPLLLGAFTIILTLQQESIAKANRNVDLHISDQEQRQNIELNIDEQRNAQLVAYMREVSDLLITNNFSLNKFILASIVRPKTLATLRQLDVTRKVYLVRFLHESRLISISNSPFLNLAGANLSHISIGSVGPSIDMRNVSFADAYLDNSSFTYMSFGFSDFSASKLRGASFIIINFDYVNFYLARLEYAEFDLGSVYKADFTSANLTGTKITQKQINSAGSISRAILPDGSNGRNPNLFRDPNCQNLILGNSSQQNVDTSEYREWLMRIRRYGRLSYMFTGWFLNSSDLRANFTEFNENGDILQKYCYGNKDLVTHLTKNKLCIASLWTYSPITPSNYTNQYEYITKKMNGHNETYMVNIDINLGQHETCRDVYFSIETA